MSLRLSLVIDGDATSAKKAAEETQHAVATLSQGADRGAKSVAAAERESAAALQRVAAAYNGKVAAMKVANAAMVGNANVARLNTFQMQNLAFQINDIGTMLASGQSPFVMLMQQGMQISQIFGSGVGVGAAMRATGAAIFSFVTNPLNLAVLGIAAAAGGVSMLWNSVSDSGAADEALDRHQELIKRIKDRYGEAGEAAFKYLAVAERVSLFEAQQNAERARKALEVELQPVANIRFLSESRGWHNPLPPEFKSQLDALRQAAAAGSDSILEIRKRFEDIGARSPVGSDMRELVDYILTRTEDAAKAAQTYREALTGQSVVDGSFAQKQLEQNRRRAADMFRNSMQLPAMPGRFDAAFGTAAAASTGVADSEIMNLTRLAKGWTDFGDGVMRGLERYQSGAAGIAEMAGATVASIAQKSEDAIAKMLTGTKVDFADMARSILADTARMAARSLSAGVSNALQSGLQSLLGGLAGGVGQIGGAHGVGSVATGYVWGGVNHRGYGPGDPMSFRMLPAEVWAGAPRFHKGIGPGERAAVLTDDESVLTPGQMRALGNRGGVKIEIINQGGVPIRDGGRRHEDGMDIQRIIVGAVAEDIAENGPVARSIEMAWPGVGARRHR